VGAVGVCIGGKVYSILVWCKYLGIFVHSHLNISNKQMMRFQDVCVFIIPLSQPWS
jgi:hypothetical protein